MFAVEGAAGAGASAPLFGREGNALGLIGSMRRRLRDLVMIKIPAMHTNTNSTNRRPNNKYLCFKKKLVVVVVGMLLIPVGGEVTLGRPCNETFGNVGEEKEGIGGNAAN